MLTPSRYNSHSPQPRSKNTPTLEYGVQVDLKPNPENTENYHYLICDQPQESSESTALSPAENRKLKKKLNKKRRKQKAEEMQRQARRRIGNIIQQFYEGRACFQDYESQIEQQMGWVYNSDFREYLDQLIRMRVNYIQKKIWEYTQSILDENPFERIGDHLFYSQMVEHVYHRYLEIQHSSRQIEKVINVYLRYLHHHHPNTPQNNYPYQSLAINTFNYMIQTDHTLRNLLHICHLKISPQKKWHHEKLATLISFLRNCHSNCYDEDDDEESTLCPQDEINEQNQEHVKKRRKPSRKAKAKHMTSEEEDIVQRMEQFTLKEYRMPCRVEEEVIERWRNRAEQYRKFRKVQQFQQK